MAFKVCGRLKYSSNPPVSWAPADDDPPQHERDAEDKFAKRKQQQAICKFGIPREVVVSSQNQAADWRKNPDQMVEAAQPPFKVLKTMFPANVWLRGLQGL